MGEFWISVSLEGTREQAEQVLADFREFVAKLRERVASITEPALVEDWLSPDALTPQEQADLQVAAINKEIIDPPDNW